MGNQETTKIPTRQRRRHDASSTSGSPRPLVPNGDELTMKDRKGSGATGDWSTPKKQDLKTLISKGELGKLKEDVKKYAKRSQDMESLYELLRDASQKPIEHKEYFEAVLEPWSNDQKVLVLNQCSQKIGSVRRPFKDHQESHKEAYHVAERILEKYPDLAKHVAETETDKWTLFRDAIRLDAIEVVNIGLSALSDADKALVLSKADPSPLEQAIDAGRDVILKLFLEVPTLKITSENVDRAMKIRFKMEPKEREKQQARPSEDVIAALVTRYPQHVSLQTFEDVVMSGDIYVFDILLDLEEVQKLLENSDILEIAVKQKNRDMIQTLLDLFPGQANLDVFKSVVVEGYGFAWETLMNMRTAGDILKGSDILHEAVRHKQCFIVKSLMNEYPDLCLLRLEYQDEEDSEELKPALYFNRPDKNCPDPEFDAKRTEIRKLIAPHIIIRASLEDARKLLCDDLGNRKEIGLSLDTFHYDPEGCKSFLRNVLPGATSAIDVQFETALKYVELSVPPVPITGSLSWDKEYLQVTGRAEVFLILKWLRDKNVQTVCELHVRDSVHHPHSEEDMATLGKYFSGLEVLDWRRMDVSLETVMQAAPNLKTLHLYASGWPALSYWTGPEGVGMLAESNEKLEEVHITIVRDNMSATQAMYYEKQTSERLQKIKKSLDRELNCSVKRSTWEEIQGKQVTISSGEPPASTPVEKTKLRAFHEGYKALFRSVQQFEADLAENLRHLQISKSNLRQEVLVSEDDLRTKVAVIDSGLNQSFSHPTGTGTRDYRITGASFVREKSRESPWYCPVDPHGTQMATIIRELDPECNLFVARVCSTKRDLSQRTVAEAIQWAIKRGVDIISLSLAFHDERCPRELGDAIRDAYNAGIVVLASTSDEGLNKTEVWPAYNENVIAVSSADAMGRPTRDPPSKKDGPHFYFQGEDIAVGGALIKGSSVATAMAAGVASLLIACHRIGRSIEPLDIDVWKRASRKKQGLSETGWHIVTTCFGEMTAKRAENNYCAPWNFFPETSNDWVFGDATDVHQWILKKFRDLKLIEQKAAINPLALSAIQPGQLPMTNGI